MTRHKHVCCYSGGLSSALVAIEVTRRYGAESVILVNHDLSSKVEHQDVKRFKTEVADYLGLKIQYVNHPNWEAKDQIDVCVDTKAWKVGVGTALCTNRLKTAPFDAYLKQAFEDRACTLYYGFDPHERNRWERRTRILGERGYATGYPLMDPQWPRTIRCTTEVGIPIPSTYAYMKHANCMGCLKGGRQHWYVCYSKRPDIFYKAKWAEVRIGYTIIRGVALKDLEPMFRDMADAGVVAEDRTQQATFWKNARTRLKSIPRVTADPEDTCATACEGLC